MTLQLLPDAERFLSAFLRAQPEVAALVAARVYTVLPEEKVWPTVRLTRVGGAPADLGDLALWADDPSIQVEVWAARKADAWQVARTVLAVAAERLVGAHPDHGLRVLGRRFGAIRYVPDPTFTPAQPRVLFTLDLTIKPQGGNP